MSEAAAADGEVAAARPDADLGLIPTLVVAIVAGAGLASAAHAGALALLVAVAIAQALLAFAWIYGTAMPGRRGAVVIAVMAASAADVCTSVWPHGRLGALLAVLGLAVPVMFVHQLARGAARVQVVSSLGAVAALVFCEVSLPALLQLRHEFGSGELAARVSSASVAALAGAVVVGCLVDMIFPAPRFDPDVPRGLLGLVASAGLGASLGYLILRPSTQFPGPRAAFIGAALGALAGLLAVAGAFVLYTTPPSEGGLAPRLRPVLAALLPVAALAPVAFLLCLAIRS